MGVGRLEKNTSVRLEGRNARVRAILEGGTYQFEDDHGRITSLQPTDVLRKLRARELVLPAKPSPPRQKSAVVLSAEELAVVQERLEYVRAIGGLPNTRDLVDPVIEEVWQKLKRPAKKPYFTTVYRWKLRYDRSGKDGRTLLDNHRAKGNRKARYCDEVVEICRGAIDPRYLTRERGTIQDAIDDALNRIDEENRLRPPETRLQLPSRRLVRRLINSLPAVEKHIARYGRESARHAFRAVKGRNITNAPLERAEIDHTNLDLIVIDPDSGLPLGRPYLTLCIDAHTRCVLGMYIGFVPPSYQSVAACLKDCLTPKDDLKLRFPRISNDWPCFGVMQTLVLDNGREFHSESLESACLSLNISLDYCSRSTPWLKGKIERFFGTMARGLFHKIPGTTLANIKEKGDYDPQKNACVTLSDLNEIVRKWIVDVYHADHQRMIDTSPLQMWRQSVRLEDVPLPDDSVDLDLVLSAGTRRTLTHKGIELMGLFYQSPELIHQLQLRGPKQQVEVRYNPGDLGTINVVFNDGQIATARCLAYEYANGLSEYQHEVIKHRRAALQLQDSSEGLIQAKADLQKLIAEALKGKKALGRRVARFNENLIGAAVPEVSGRSNPPQTKRAEQLSTKHVPTRAPEEELEHDDIPIYEPIYHSSIELARNDF